MRNIVAFIATLLFSVNTLAQDTTFVKFYGGAENETGTDLIQVGNHFYLIGTYGSGGHGLTDLYVVKTDTLGNRIWTSVLGTPAVEMATSGAAMGDTAVIIVGYTNSTFENTYDGLLTCIDSAGNELWSTTIGGPNWDMLHSVIVDTDGNIVAVGETSSSGAGGADGLLVKYDSHGNFLYQKTFGGPDVDRLKTLAQLTSTEYVLGGDFESGAIDSTDIIIIRTDLNGNALHTKYHGGVGMEIVNKIIISADKNLAIAGATSTGSAGGLDFNLMRTDTLGNIAWQERFGGPDNEQWRDAFINSNQTVLCVGHSYSQIGGGKEEVFLYKFNFGGWFEHLTTFGSLENDFGIGIIAASNPGTYLFMGTTNSFGCGNDDIFIGRSKNDGGMSSYSMFEFCDTTGTLTSVQAISHHDMRVFRDDNLCVVEIPTELVGSRLELYDICGRPLLSTSLVSSINKINVLELGPIIGKIYSDGLAIKSFILQPYVH
jgi:hypothetical protein